MAMLVISALLRIAEPSSGRILIDGVDTRTIGLHLLRSSLSVISQDAVLLAGTIRYNLDPLQQYDDTWLHRCLQRVGLVDGQQDSPDAGSEDNRDKDMASHPSGLEKTYDSESVSCSRGLTLDLEVKENGANLSHGQRSLISIARALARRSRIVILDEATASIDGRADTEIQAMLNKVMGDATVVTVAHRLETIMTTCDRIVVMDSGRIVEVGSMPELYCRPGGLFRGLCLASNITIRR